MELFFNAYYFSLILLSYLVFTMKEGVGYSIRRGAGRWRTGDSRTVGWGEGGGGRSRAGEASVPAAPLSNSQLLQTCKQR